MRFMFYRGRCGQSTSDLVWEKACGRLDDGDQQPVGCNEKYTWNDGGMSLTFHCLPETWANASILAIGKTSTEYSCSCSRIFFSIVTHTLSVALHKE